VADVSGCVFFANYIGFHAEYSNGSRVTGCSFQSEKYAGIRFWRCPGGILSGCTVNDSMRIALYAAGSNVSGINTSLVSGMYDAYLEDGALVELVNCTQRSKNLFFHDAADRLNASWYLDLGVLWWSSEVPVPGAAVNVTDPSGNSTFSGVTDPQGWLRGGIVPGYSMNLSGMRVFGPYTVNATRSGLVASNTTWVNGTVELRLLLDDIGPAMLIEHPAPGSFVNTSFVSFSGSAWDNETRVAKIEGSIDNGSWISANGTSSWSFAAALPDGPHVVRIRGTDTSNNFNIAPSTFTVDTRAPVLTIGSPKDGNFTRERQVNITGATEPGGNATVRVGGAPAYVDNATGNFSATVNISEGDNTITVEAMDHAGNTASMDIHIRSDTMVTPFYIHPENGTWTNRSEVTVNGTVEPGSRLVLWVADQQGNFTGNGTSLNITTGNFSVNITLHNGTNLILVEAFDGFGNSAAQYINVTMDNTPPLINLTSPTSGEYQTNQARLNFAGRVEPDASVFLNGRVVLVNDGGFNQSKTLQPGPNLFVLTAVDRAGNVRTMNFNITFDRTPPMLFIRSPRDRSTTTGGSILVFGTTEAGATVTMNGRPARPDASGNFKGQVPLRMGHNSIDIVATDIAGNQATEHIVVDRAQAPPLLYDWQIGLLTVAIVVCVFVGIVAWDTRRTTGTWALKRPAWLRIPDRVRGYIPRPVFGREEFDSGPGAVSGAPRKKVGEPAEHGAHPTGASAGPPAQPAEPLPAARLGDEFIVSEKPLSVQSGTMPAATEVPAQLPVAEPVGPAGGPAGDISAAPGPAAPAGGQPAPVVQPAPAGQPAAPPKPEEPDPLAEILGHPTKKI
jgi:parallel beta-helix repeat protein